jgi:predicted GNAT superfamily acetyltransferase
MNYRILETIREFEQAVEVEIAVWGLNPRDCVPLAMLRAVIHTGGVVLGAYDGDAMVGMAFAFPARYNSNLILWSHMTGVVSEYQRQDIGFTLKHKQREWALSNGYDEIGWTFDPLRRGNANFNLHRLGATANVYHVNFYGEMEDAINAGTPSDRLEVIWKLNDPRVASLAQGQTIPTTYPSISAENTVLRANGDFPTLTPSLESPFLFAEVPSSIDTISKEAADAWRLALREALQNAFTCGFTAVDFIHADGRHWYVLRRL